jgi:hypothetical protein
MSKNAKIAGFLGQTRLAHIPIFLIEPIFLRTPRFGAFQRVKRYNFSTQNTKLEL